MAVGPKENTVEAHLTSRVKKLRGETIKQYKRGWPDRLVCLPGVPLFFVETKRPKGGRYEALQLRTHVKLRRMGHTVVVAKTKEEVDECLAQYGTPGTAVRKDAARQRRRSAQDS